MRDLRRNKMVLLRIIAIAAPIAFAVTLGVFTEDVLRRWFSAHEAHVIATAILTCGVIVFTFAIFGVLESMQAQLESHRQRESSRVAEMARMAERERIGKLVQEVVEKQAQEWGLEVTGIRLQDIGMPEELKKIMSRQAAAEREKRATITKAEGDRLAAENLAAAAATMTASPGAMQLRTLQTIDGLGPSASNTVVLAVPIEIMELAKKMSESIGANGVAGALSRG